MNDSEQLEQMRCTLASMIQRQPAYVKNLIAARQQIGLALTAAKADEIRRAMENELYSRRTLTTTR